MRHRLENRRYAETISYTLSNSKYVVSVGYRGESPLEIFINTEMKRGSEADVNAQDGAVAVSLALQYGCPIDVLRDAMKRNSDGTAQGPLGKALDVISGAVNP